MEKKDKDKTNDMFVWPKRAINKILFSWLINKPQGVLGRLPQHFKHLVLEQSTKTQDPLDILWAADKSEGSPPYFLRKIKQNMVILYQTGGGAAEGSFFVRRGDAMSVAWGSLNQTATTIINYGRKKKPQTFHIWSRMCSAFNHQMIATVFNFALLVSFQQSLLSFLLCSV